MFNKIKILINYLICFISTFILSFGISQDNKIFLILISITLIFLIINVVLKIDIKIIKKFLIIICCLMLIFSFNLDYFSSISAPGVKEYILSILTILVLPFMSFYEILLNYNLIEYTIIIIPLYFYTLYVLSTLLDKIIKSYK